MRIYFIGDQTIVIISIKKLGRYLYHSPKDINRLKTKFNNFCTVVWEKEGAVVLKYNYEERGKRLT